MSSSFLEKSFDIGCGILVISAALGAVAGGLIATKEMLKALDEKEKKKTTTAAKGNAI